MFFAIAVGGILSAVLILFATVGAFSIYKLAGTTPSIPGVVLAACIAAFCSLGTAKFVWDWIHPKVWSLYLTPDAIGWQTPQDSASVPLADIQKVAIQDIYDAPRLAITLRRGGTLHVHSNCLGNLETLWHKLHEASPRVELTYDGHASRRIRAFLAADSGG